MLSQQLYLLLSFVHPSALELRAVALDQPLLSQLLLCLLLSSGRPSAIGSVSVALEQQQEQQEQQEQKKLDRLEFYLLLLICD